MKNLGFVLMFAFCGWYHSMGIEDITNRFIFRVITLYPLIYWWWNIFRKDINKINE